MKLGKISSYNSLYFVLDNIGIDCLYKGKLNRMYIIHRQRIGYHESYHWLGNDINFYL
jgi:hypothetical protein